MRTYTRRGLLRKTSLAASAAFGVSLARVPLLHAAGPAHEKLGSPSSAAAGWANDFHCSWQGYSDWSRWWISTIK